MADRALGVYAGASCRTRQKHGKEAAPENVDADVAPGVRKRPPRWDKTIGMRNNFSRELNMDENLDIRVGQNIKLNAQRSEGC